MQRAAARRISMIAIGMIALLVPTSALAGPPSLNAVTFTVYACPASIQTPADLETAGGPSEICAVGGKVGAFPTLSGGYSWTITPIEYDLQASAHVHGARLSNPQATAGGSCDSETFMCHAFQAYGWFNVPVGRLTLTETTVPPGFSFGWANVYVDGQAVSASVDSAARTILVRAPRGAQGLYVEFI